MRQRLSDENTISEAVGSEETSQESRRDAEADALEDLHEESEGHEGSTAEEEVELDSDQGSVRLHFMKPLVRYFSALEQKLIDELVNPSESASSADGNEEFPDIVAEDDLQFDEQSINAAVSLCKRLETYVKNYVSDKQFEDIQGVHLFYESPQQLLDMVKLLFIGDLIAKEKVVRIYGAKVFGTHKVVSLILETPELFEDLEEVEAVKVKKTLLKFSEDPLRQFKRFFLASEQVQIADTGPGLSDGIRKTLSMKNPLFDETHDYNQVIGNFRDFIFCLYGNTLILEYVHWKDQYMRYWMFNELYRLDIQNMLSSAVNVPQYTMIKMKVFQQLDSIFLSLDRTNRVYDKSLALKKSHYRTFSQGEAYLPNADTEDRGSLIKAREAEKVLMDSLNPIQISTIAEKVHMEVANLRRKPTAKGKAPSSANMRSVDIGSEKKAEKKYIAATAKVQATQAKQRGKKPPSTFFKAMGKLVKVLKILPSKPKVEKPKVAEEEEMPNILPRAEGNTEGPLENAQVDWCGFGKEFKSTIYERTYPSMQKRFFEHGEFKLRLGDDFPRMMEKVFQFYREHDYVRVKKHKMGVSGTGGGGVKEFLDEAIYLKIDNDTILSLGFTPFSKNAPIIPYLQLFRTKPLRVQKGAMKNADYTRVVNGVKYFMENIENSNDLRHLLFRSLIKVLDSLPDELRNQFLDMLQTMGEYLVNVPDPLAKSAEE